MSVPNFSNKRKGKPILTPEHMLAYRQNSGMLPKGIGPEAVVLCLQKGLPERLKRRHPFRILGKLNGDVLLLNKTNNKVMVLANFGLGSPLMAAVTEELIAWGAQRLISVSMSGAIQEQLNTGDIVVCDRALRDEGTSHHYLPAGDFINADPDLVSRLVGNLQAKSLAPHVGATWTTDAAYRETDLEVEHYQKQGIQTVDMESAALFTVAKVHGKQAATIFVIGDSLADLTWKGPQDLARIERSLEAAYDAAIETLSGAK
ncbi:MAG TPA: nucleoside phosphorylase [Anaerolineales bacterium]